MLLIDAVVHALHVASRDDLPGNFAARNFLEGSRPKIVALLDELACGPGSNVAERARARWQAARDHYRSLVEDDLGSPRADDRGERSGHLRRRP
jgi:hypothetical protein